MNARRTYPVLYHGQEIGHAATERGAKSHAAHMPKLGCERWTASLRERLGDDDRPAGLAWFVGLQLRQGRTA